MVLGELWWCMHVSEAVVSDQRGEHRTLPPSLPRSALVPMVDGPPFPPYGSLGPKTALPLRTACPPN